jgi:hypothetical protein
MSDSNGKNREILDKLARSQGRLTLLEAEMQTNKKIMIIVTVLALATVCLNRCK